MHEANSNRLYLSQVIGALSYAFDLTEGQGAGHCLRSCWIGTHIGMELGLKGAEISDLYYTLLIKDSGGSSNAGRLYEHIGREEKRAMFGLRVSRSMNATGLMKLAPKTVQAKTELKQRLRCLSSLGRRAIVPPQDPTCTRSKRGALIAAKLGFDQPVANGVYSVPEHWDGTGRPQGISGAEIPLSSRIVQLAQVVDLFHGKVGKDASIAEAQARSGASLDPGVVAAFERVAQSDDFWSVLKAEHLEDFVAALEPGDIQVELTDERLDSIAVAFAQIIDAKSHFTSGHSERVAQNSMRIGQKLGFAGSRLKWIWRGALLHDIGKLGVSSYIWDKPGKLNEDDWRQIRQHPTFTGELLSRINPFRNMATIAGNHHEKLDGSGYPNALTAENIALESRIIAVADIYDALIADRPYRKGMSQERALDTLSDMATEGEVDAVCFKALLMCMEDEEQEQGVA